MKRVAAPDSRYCKPASTKRSMFCDRLESILRTRWVEPAMVKWKDWRDRQPVEPNHENEECLHHPNSLLIRSITILTCLRISSPVKRFVVWRNDPAIRNTTVTSLFVIFSVLRILRFTRNASRICRLNLFRSTALLNLRETENPTLSVPAGAGLITMKLFMGP